MKGRRELLLAEFGVWSFCVLNSVSLCAFAFSRGRGSTESLFWVSAEDLGCDLHSCLLHPQARILPVSIYQNWNLLNYSSSSMSYNLSRALVCTRQLAQCSFVCLFINRMTAMLDSEGFVLFFSVLEIEPMAFSMSYIPIFFLCQGLTDLLAGQAGSSSPPSCLSLAECCG